MVRTRYLLLCISLVICACAAKENAPMKPTAESQSTATSTTSTQGSLSASIDGQVWQATPAWSKDKDAAMASVDANGLVTIRGTRMDSALSTNGTTPVEVMEIILKSSQPGTYTLEPSFANLQTATFSIGTDTSKRFFIHEKQSGQAVISQSDGHHLSGTFSFDASNSQGKTLRVSNGTFDITIKQ
jgi:hypothetical protein